MDKKIYLSISSEIIHHGHINIILKASEYGKVIVGVLTDEAVSSYKATPLISYEDRVKIIGQIKGVDSVVKQETLDYEENLLKLKPDYVIHGDDWKIGVQSAVRDKIIKLLDTWGGQLVEIPYTHDVTIDKLNSKFNELRSLPEIRRATLKNLLNTNKIVRTMEAHNGLSALVVENAKYSDGNNVRIYDAMWLSSLTDSTAKGKPDIELVDMTSRFNTINEIMEVTTKPIIMDGDTGGLIEHFVYNVKTLERIGVSAIIIEDKKGLKKNSLFGTEVEQTQDSIENFCEKISAGVKAKSTEDFMVIARIESLILGKGMDDAIKRAKAYVGAGANGILIHSRNKSPDEIFEFCDKYKALKLDKPLVVVPSSFNEVYENQLIEKGVSIVIYANQLIRSAYPSMMDTAEKILKYERCKEVDENCLGINEILNLIPGGK